MSYTRYQLLDQLGQGGMGVVYRAKDQLTGQTVALKQVRIKADNLIFTSKSTDNDSETSRIALAREFRILATLRHPYIVSVLDYGFTPEHVPYFTMSYLDDAQTITQALTDPHQRIIQLLEALTYLHRRGILHRDLKPDNVLVNKAGEVQVMDFGLALDSTRRSLNPDDSEHFVGTLTYIAPELLSGGEHSAASDLHAVGMLAYEILLQTYPFEKERISRLLLSIRGTQPDTSRLDPPIAAWLDAMLAKDPANRPTSALDALDGFYAAVGQTAPPQPAAIRESYLQASAFVGREHELAALRHRVTQTRTYTLIGGESGVGKSRLMEEVRINAMVEGVQVLTGTIHDEALPYEAWRDVLRLLLFDVNVSDIEAAILKEIIPTMDDILGRRVKQAPPLADQDHQNRLVLTIVEVLKRIQQPTLIVLEDIHWARESLLPLQHMLTVREQLPHVMVIATYRSEERPFLPEEVPDMDHIRLKRLTREGIVTLTQAMLGQQSQALIDLLEEQTEGNTFFMVEAIRALAEEAGRLDAIQNMELPTQLLTGGMQSVLKRRLEKLPAHYQPVLHHAAVAGHTIDKAILQQAVPTADITGWLYAAEVASVLTVRDDTWQFTHAKLREAVLAEMPTPRRAEVHRAVAQATESVYTGNTAYDDILLEHWHAAGDLDKEVAYLSRVADQLINRAADYVYALALLNRTLDALPDDDQRVVTLLNLKAHALQYQASYAESKATAEKAVALAKAHDDVIEQAKGQHVLGAVAINQDRREAALRHYEASLAAYRTAGNTRDEGRVLVELASLSVRLGDFDTALAHLNTARTLITEHQDAFGLLKIAGELGIMAHIQGDYQQSLAHFKQTVTLSEEMGDRRAQARALSNLGFLSSTHGDVEAARDYLTRASALFQHIGDRQGVAGTLINLGFVAAPEAQREVFTQALHASQQIGSPLFVLETLVGFGWVLMHEGQLDRAAEVIGMVQAHPDNNGDIQLRLDAILAAVDFPTAALTAGQALTLEEVTSRCLTS